MLNRLRSRLSAPLVLSLIALFAALGGGAAIALPGKNTIDSGDIKKNAVKSSDIKNDKVTGADVKESTLDIPQSALPADDVFGVATNDSGSQVTDSTIPGASVQKTSNVFVWTFPRNVVDCVPVVSGIFSLEFTALQAGTAPENVNKVFVTQGGGTGDHNLIVTCP